MINPGTISAIQSIKQNPMRFLVSRRFNIPNNIDMSNSSSIIEYLINSGQVSQDQVNQVDMSAKSNPIFNGFRGRK